MSHESPITPLTGWLLVTLVCLWAIATTGFEALEFAHSINWEQTIGTVISDDRYAYDVEGKTYESNRKCFAEVKRRKADQTATLQPNSEVTVYYNPQSPGKSVLQRKLAPAGCAWFGLSLVGLCYVSRQLENTEESPATVVREI